MCPFFNRRNTLLLCSFLMCLYIELRCLNKAPQALHTSGLSCDVVLGHLLASFCAHIHHTREFLCSPPSSRVLRGLLSQMFYCIFYMRMLYFHRELCTYNTKYATMVLKNIFTFSSYQIQPDRNQLKGQMEVAVSIKIFNCFYSSSNVP